MFPGILLALLTVGAMVCVSPPAHATVLDVRVAVPNDDAEQDSTGSMDLSSSDLELMRDANRQIVGIRWSNLTIPQGATINAAWIQFTSKQADTEATTITIRGNAADTAAVFTTTSGHLGSRPLTAASVPWTPTAWTGSGLAGAEQRTPDLRSVIQELVNRPGWKWRGSLALILSGTGRRVAWSYNGNSTSAALLHIDYTSSTPPPNEAPLAVLNVTPAPSPALTVNASAAGSSDPDANPIASYRFTWGDGTAATVITAPAQTTSHTYSAAGTYTVTLIATDTGGLQSQPVSKVISVLPPGVSALEKRIATSGDDVEEDAALAVNVSSGDLELVLDGGSNQVVGMRWPGITIPQGAVITSAWVQFVSRQADTQATSLAFWGEAADASAAFTSAAGNVSSRTRTSASVSWTPASWATAEAGANQRTPDLKNVIQQIVSRAGWVSGNALAIIVTGTGRRTAWSFNGDPTLAPLLHIEYSTSQSPPTNSPPVASLSVTQLAAPPLTVTASGANSTDTDANPIASYRFTWGDGTPATVTTVPNSSASHTYAASGTYTITLQVTDTGGLQSTVVSQSFTVNPPPNQAPIANLAVSQAASPPLTVDASAAGSSDSDANPIASYSFAWGDGTSPTVTNHPTVTASHTYATSGTYTVTLTATDTGGLDSNPVSRSITIMPAGAAALDIRVTASADDAEESSTGTVNLSSSDLELVNDGSNQTVGLRWLGVNIPQGATITSAYIQFTSKQADTQVTSLTIQGQAADAAATFASGTGNVSSRPRTAGSVAWTPNSWTTSESGANTRTPDLKTIVQQIVNRPGWASGNPLALVLTGTGRRTAWSFNGGAAIAPLLHVEYTTGPPPPNDPPVASLSVNQVMEPPLTVNANGAGSTDTDAFPIASYRFTWGDGTPATVTNAPTAASTHTYAAPGQYTVTLQVTDTGGLQSATVSMTIEVLPPPNQPPVANLTVAQAQNPPLTVSASAAGSTDNDQEPIASYTFTWGDGTAATAINHPTLVATHTYAAAGTYTVTLTATDTGNLTSAPVTRSITINPPVITTVERRVVASADDAEQAPSGSVNLTDQDLELAADGSNSQTVGMRWTSLAVPQGVTIQAAWIQFGARIANSAACNVTFQGQAADAAAAFTTSSNNISSRTRTAASVSWSPGSWSSGAAGAAQRTPDLKAIIQEVVNRPGWASGNAMAMIVTGSGTRTAWSFNGSSGQAPLLHVEYVGGSGSTNQPPTGQLAVQPTATPLTASASAAGSSDPDSPIASYRFTWGDGTATTVVNHPTVTANHTYGTAGTYTVSLVVVDAFGAQSTPVTRSVTVSATPSQIAVYVGYYGTHHPGNPRPKPSPWMGSPGITFVGTPDSPSGGWDSSAIRIDNLTGSPISNVVVTVDMGSDHFALWGTRSIPAGGKLILAQTGFENFDGSDTSPAGCYGCNPNDCITKVENTVPVVNITIAGTTTRYYDVDQIMNTQGADGAGCPYTGTRNDESWPWTQVGTNPNAVRIEETLISTAGESEVETEAAPVLAMGPPFPNPAIDGVVLRFSVATRGRTQITLYDVAGRRVKSLLDWEMEPGRYQRAADLRSVKPGVYFCELKTPTGSVKTSLIVTR